MDRRKSDMVVAAGTKFDHNGTRPKCGICGAKMLFSVTFNDVKNGILKPKDSFRCPDPTASPLCKNSFATLDRW